MARNSPWAYQKGVLWALELPAGGAADSQLARPLEPPLGTEFEEILPDEPGNAFDGLEPAIAEDFSRRLTLGRRCFAGRVDGKLAVYGWVSTGAECVGEMEREIRPGPGEAYVWDCFTLPAYRRQGLYSALLSHIKISLTNEGCRRIWIGSNMENEPSLRGFARAGFRPVAYQTYLRLAELSFIWTNGHHDAPGHLVNRARDVFAMDGDRKMGRLIVGRARPDKLAACAELGV